MLCVCSVTPTTGIPVPSPLQNYNRSLLKSLIQKAVRRGLSDVAVRATWQLLRQDPTSCIRRLAIIVMEDAILHDTGMRLLTWLMCSGLHPTIEDARLILQIVHEIATCKHRDVIVKDPVDIGFDTADERVYSVLIRAYFGGMRGDVAFMRNFAAIWTTRFKTDESRWTQLLNDAYSDSGTCPEPQELVTSDLKLEAVDFHAFPQLLIEIQDKFKIEPELSKRAIWRCRSSQTLKSCITEGDTKIEPTEEDIATFQIIRGYVDARSMFIWKNRGFIQT